MNQKSNNYGCNINCLCKNANKCDKNCYYPSCINTQVVLPSSLFRGAQGIPGPTGPAGPAGQNGVLSFADFYALMPPDNAATVAPGSDVNFPQNGPSSGNNILRTGPSTFNLVQSGSYQIFFNVGANEAGQLLLSLNGNDLDYTVVGRATGTSDIIGMSIVTSTEPNSILTVRNPAGNATALTITPLAGGTRPVSAHLVIIQIG